MMSLYDHKGVESATQLAMQNGGTGRSCRGEGDMYRCLWDGPFHLVFREWGVLYVDVVKLSLPPVVSAWRSCPRNVRSCLIELPVLVLRASYPDPAAQLQIRNFLCSRCIAEMYTRTVANGQIQCLAKPSGRNAVSGQRAKR